MNAKLKKNVVLLLLCAMFLLSLCGLGAVTLVRAEDENTQSVTLQAVKAENVSTSVYAKFVLQDENNTSLTIAAGTNMENSMSSDTEDSYFSKIVFSLNGAGNFQGTHTFKELWQINSAWNLHVGWDSIDGTTTTFMINNNSCYVPVNGDTITLLAGLHVMNNSGGFVYTDYVLSENVTVVYDNGALRVLGDTEAYSVTLNRTSASITLQGELELTATVIESVKDTPLTVNWTSSDEGVATVSDGTVTPVGEGTATITASVAKPATCSVTVVDGSVVEISESEKSVAVNSSAFSLSAEAITSNESDAISWKTDKEGVVELSANTGNTITVTPVGIGTVTITASADGASDTCTVTVGLDKSYLKLENGTTGTVSAGESSSVTWSTQNSSVATVSDGTITATGNGTTKIVATTSDGDTAEVEVYVFTYEEISFTNVTLSSSNHVQFAGLSFNTNYTNLESEKNNTAFAAFFDNFLIDGYTLSELNSQSNYSNWNVNIHIFTTYVALYVYDSSDGDKDLSIPVGTQFTFKEGCVLPIKEGGEWVLSEVRIASDATYTLLDDNSFAQLAEEGSEVTVSAMGVMEHSSRGYYEFTITLSLLAYNGTTTVAATDTYSTEYIQINGYAVAEINAANGSAGVQIFYSNRSLIVNVLDGTTMNGASLIDTEGHTTYFTILEGFTTPTGYVFEESYSKYYYGDMEWWSDEYTGIEDSGVRLEIDSIGAVAADAANDIAFIIYFTEAVFNYTVHVNGVCSWLNTTPYADLIDGQLTTGVKAAVWYGVKIDGRTIYDYMFNSGMTNATNQSTIVAVHFDTAYRMRIVFSGTLLTGFEADAAHTLEFDANLFYTNTGARFASNVLYTYDNETWTNQSAVTGISLDKTSATLAAGDSLTLAATVTGGTAADLSVTFSSSDTSVATVDQEGNVTAVAAGTVTITATASDGQTAACEITVTASDDGGDEGNGGNEGGEGGDSGEEKSGCGSSVAVGGAFAAILLLAGAVLVIATKKRSEK